METKPIRMVAMDDTLVLNKGEEGNLFRKDIIGGRIYYWVFLDRGIMIGPSFEKHWKIKED